MSRLVILRLPEKVERVRLRWTKVLTRRLCSRLGVGGRPREGAPLHQAGGGGGVAMHRIS